MDIQKAQHFLVIYELNEVSYRVIDYFTRNKPDSAIANLVKNSSNYTTMTSDYGELHPWTTWPTLHRGVTNAVHDIRFINQNLDCADAYPPIWQTLQQAGKRVGVFGSLQSYPPKEGYEFLYPIPFHRVMKHGHPSTRHFSDSTYAKHSKTVRRPMLYVLIRA